MGKGKVAAQCSHATLDAYKKATKHCPDILKRVNFNDFAPNSKTFFSRHVRHFSIVVGKTLNCEEKEFKTI